MDPFSMPMDPSVIALSSREYGKDESRKPYCRIDTQEWGNLATVIIATWGTTLIGVGTIGNTLTIIILNQRGYKTNIISRMLRYLSILDILTLWTVVFEIPFHKLTNIQISSLSTPMCGILVLWSRILSSFDHWVLVVITATRLVYIKWPVKAPSICTEFTYYSFLVASHLTIALFHSVIVIGRLSLLTQQEYEDNKIFCYIKINKKGPYTGAYKAIYVMINFLLPSFLLVTLNLSIMYQLRNIQKRREKLFMTAMRAHNTSNTVGTSTNMDTTHNAAVGSGDWGDRETGHDFCQTPDQRRNQRMPTDSTHNCGTFDDESRSSLQPGNYLALSGVRTATDLCVEQPNTGDFNSSHTLSPSNSKVFTPGEGSHRVGSFRKLLVHSRSSLGFGIRRQSLTTPVDPIPLPSAARHNGSDATQSDRKLRANNSPKASSVITWISQARSNPVDMECEDDKPAPAETDANDPGDTQEQGAVSGRSVEPQEHYKGGNKLRSLTFMLMITTSVFLLTNLPFWVYHFFIVGRLGANVGCVTSRFIVESLFLLRYTNHSVNFLLYCAVGSRFRRDMIIFVRKMFCKTQNVKT